MFCKSNISLKVDHIRMEGGIGLLLKGI